MIGRVGVEQHRISDRPRYIYSSLSIQHGATWGHLHLLLLYCLYRALLEDLDIVSRFLLADLKGIRHSDSRYIMMIT